MKRIANEVREQVVTLYKSGKVQREIAEEVGISQATVGRICREAGVDMFHVGGKIAKSCPKMNNALPEGVERPKDALIVTGRTLNLHGPATGCDYVAGTLTKAIDITLGDWALSIDRDKLSGFISELEQIKKLIGAR